MELLTNEIRQRIPALSSQESTKLQDKIVYAKFFVPAGNWIWFAIEGEQKKDDFIFYGYVIVFKEEWEYFSLSELQNINIGGFTVERDINFKAGKVSDVIATFRKPLR